MSADLLAKAREIFGEDIIESVSGNATVYKDVIDVCVPDHKTVGEYRDGEITIHFTNGKSVKFWTSEWGWIEKA